MDQTVLGDEGAGHRTMELRSGPIVHLNRNISSR